MSLYVNLTIDVRYFNFEIEAILWNFILWIVYKKYEIFLLQAFP